MGTIKNHYETEMAKEKPNQLLLSQLSKILLRNTLTKSEWRLTGKFIPKNEFLLEHPEAELLKTCSEVVHYVGGAYIQVLSSGVFRYDADTKSKVLDEVEDVVWQAIAERLFCDNCGNK